MQEILDWFQKDLVKSGQIAHSLIATSDIGSQKIIKYMRENPDSGYIFVVPTSSGDSIKLQVLSDMRWKTILAVYFNHKGALIEWTHAHIVQTWSEFLYRLFKKIVTESLQRGESFAIDSSIPLGAKINKVNQDNTEKSFTSFDRVTAPDKLKIIETLLKKSIPQEYKSKIEKHILVRNIFQHSDGIVRDIDVEKFDTKAIILLDEGLKLKNFEAGNKLNISIYELLHVRYDFHKAGESLLSKH
jgi:hypothetical protein